MVSNATLCSGCAAPSTPKRSRPKTTPAVSAPPSPVVFIVLKSATPLTPRSAAARARAGDAAVPTRADDDHIDAVRLRVFDDLFRRRSAEERRTGSLELLLTLPLTPGELVLGKWLAAVAMVATALLCTLPYPVTIALLGELDWGPVFGGYLGLLLLGAAFAAIGTATRPLPTASSTTGPSASDASDT